MITTYKIPYRNGELRIGWASWDTGGMTERSIKYAYPDNSGKISRGSPELPFDILIDMLLLASDQNELKSSLAPLPKNPPLVGNATDQQLRDEKKLIATSLMRLQQLFHDIPWADWAKVYDPIGARYDAVKAEMKARGIT